MKYQEVVTAVNKIIEAYTTRLTVRQLYYRIISPPYQMFDNNLNNYKGFDKILTRARERGDVDWTKIEDRARSTIGGEDMIQTFDGPDAYIDFLLDELKESYYTKKIWDSQPQNLEVWVEKDALSSLMYQVLKPYRIRLFPSRGYSSFTGVMEGIERSLADKPTLILHFADLDPSGLDMTRDLEDRFLNYTRNNITLKRIALSHEQVAQWSLAANPTKVADARSANYVAKYGDKCWELDAVPPDALQDLVKKAVEAEIDLDLFNALVKEINGEKDQIAAALKLSAKQIRTLRKRLKKALQDGAKPPP